MIYTIIGTNQIERKKKVDGLINAFVKQHGDLAVERFDAEEVESVRVIEALQSLPFLATGKMVVVDRFTATEELTDKIEQKISSIPETNTIILTDVKVDNRAKYAKKIATLTDYHEFQQPSEKDLPSWVVTYAKGIGAEIGLSEAKILIERVGNRQDLLANEVEKLALYDKHITKENIVLLCAPVPSSSTFELLDAAFSGNKEKAIKLYDEQRTQKVEPLAILGMITWQLHVAAVVNTGEQARVNDIANRARLNPFVVTKSRRLLKRLEPGAIKELVGRAYRLHVRLKSQPLNSDDAMRHFLLTI